MRLMRCLFTVACIVVLVGGCRGTKQEPQADAHDEECDAAAVSALDLLPGDGEVAGWALVEPGRLYAGEALYDPIDGAADKYFQFGVVEGAFASYKKGEGTIDVQVYGMASPDDAAGIYSSYDDPNAEHATLGDAGAGLISNTNLDFTKGPYFIRLLSTGAAADRDELFAFSAALADAIDEPFHTPSVLGLLPEGHVPGTVKYFRTAATLDDVFYMGGNNVLGLSDATFGVSACYDTKTSPAGTRVGTNALFAVTYPTDQEADRAFAAAIKHFSTAPYRVYGAADGRDAQITVADGDADFMRLARHGSVLYGAWMIEDAARVNDLFGELERRVTRTPADGDGQ